MLKYKHFCQPDTLEEAFKLNQGRANCVLGGKMCIRDRPTTG